MGATACQDMPKYNNPILQAMWQEKRTELSSKEYKLWRLRDQGERTHVRGVLDGGFFLFIGGVRGHIQQESVDIVRFAFLDNDEYAIVTLPLERIRIKLDAGLQGDPLIRFNFSSSDEYGCLRGVETWDREYMVQKANQDMQTAKCSLYSMIHMMAWNQERFVIPTVTIRLHPDLWRKEFIMPMDGP